MMRLIIFLSVFVISTCNAQTGNSILSPRPIPLSERIGNFSMELLYRTTHAQEKRTNLIISPITVWSVLAVITEGASGNTLIQLEKALRLPSIGYRDAIRSEFRNVEQFLIVNTSTVELQKFNALFIDAKKQPRRDFLKTAKGYETRMITVNFSNSDVTSNQINTLISNITKGHIPDLVTADGISGASLLLTSAVYFRGQWSVPFNTSSTFRTPFYDSNGKKIGEVNMMYNRHTYPIAAIKALQSKILELPYGTQNRLSMLIMLPDHGVSLENMFRNLQNVSLDTVLSQIKLAQEEFSEDEVDCFLPKFKIESSLSLSKVLQSMNITDLFQENLARLPNISFEQLYVSQFIHKAEIEVTEEGTVAAAASAAEFSNRLGVIRFEANRPFCFFIVEKFSGTITFGGFYHTPSIY